MAFKRRSALDALRLSDNTYVYLKRVEKSSPEIQVTRFFSEGERAHDHANHSVPLLDQFEDPGIPNTTFLVTPLLRQFNEPYFVSVDEVTEFVRQTLEVCHIRPPPRIRL